ncbi:MAG: hypothetical protein ACJAT8_000059 [Cellvibrionaceae bacterium]
MFGIYWNDTNKKATFRSLLNSKTSIEAYYHDNGVTADEKTRKPMLFSSELTGVNEKRKVSADAVIARLSSNYS